MLEKTLSVSSGISKSVTSANGVTGRLLKKKLK
jgi:hypothetical protein